MSKITKRYLQQRVDLLNTSLHTELKIDWAGQPVRPRLFIETESGGSRDVGPRLQPKYMALFLDAIDEAFFLMENYGKTKEDFEE